MDTCLLNHSAFLKGFFIIELNKIPKKPLSIEEALTTSSILIFSTNFEGQVQISRGELLSRPSGEYYDGFLGVVVEGYDFSNECYLYINSYNSNLSFTRFLFIEVQTTPVIS